VKASLSWGLGESPVFAESNFGPKKLMPNAPIGAVIKVARTARTRI